MEGPIRRCRFLHLFNKYLWKDIAVNNNKNPSILKDSLLQGRNREKTNKQIHNMSDCDLYCREECSRGRRSTGEQVTIHYRAVRDSLTGKGPLCTEAGGDAAGHTGASGQEHSGQRGWRV